MKPLVPLRTRAVQFDPFCANYEAGDYVKWFVEHASLSSCRAQALVAQNLASYTQFPPQHRPGSFSIEIMEKLRNN
jgi:arylsulfatase